MRRKGGGLALLVLALASCSAGPHHTAKSHAISPVSRMSTDPKLPAGWTRFSYGSLSVGAPRMWTIRRAPLHNCFAPPPHTVSEYTTTTLTESSCPSEHAGPPWPPTAVAIACFGAKANGVFGGSATTMIVHGTTLSRSGDVVWLQGRSSEGSGVGERQRRASKPRPHDPGHSRADGQVLLDGLT